jgi:hypothetical protein
MPTKEEYQRRKDDPEYKRLTSESNRRYREKHYEKIRQKKKEYYENREPNTKCKLCDTMFFKVSAMSKFCSRGCFYKDAKTSRLGKGNPAYRNGCYQKGNRAGMLLKEKLLMKIRNRIKEGMEQERGYIYCQRCDTSNSMKWELHHIVFRSEAMKHKNLHNERNLILCCMKCHNEFHKHKDSRKGLLKDRRLWELFPDIHKLKNF